MEKDWLWYYSAKAYSKEKGTTAYIGIYARNIQEAESRYKECVARHPDIDAVSDPEIGRGGEEIEFYSDKSKEEIEQFNSALIHFRGEAEYEQIAD